MNFQTYLKIAFMQAVQVQVMKKAALLLVAHCRYMLRDKPSPVSHQCPEQQNSSHSTCSGNRKVGVGKHCSTCVSNHRATAGSQCLVHCRSQRCKITGTDSMLSDEAERSTNTDSNLTHYPTQQVSTQNKSMLKDLDFAAFLDACNPLCTVSPVEHVGILPDIAAQVGRVTAHLDLTASHHVVAANAEMKSDDFAQVSFLWHTTVHSP